LKLKSDPFILQHVESWLGPQVGREMSAIIGLSSVAGFLAIAALAIVVGRKPAGSIVYGASLIIAASG
jgi:hypothetical protein